MKRPSVYVAMRADILHSGHIEVLDAAAKLGEVTVGLLTDSAVAVHDTLPCFTYDQRRRVLESLRQVARVVPQHSHDPTENLRELRPRVVVHTHDWRDGLPGATGDQVRAAIGDWGGELIELDHAEQMSQALLDDALREVVTLPTARRARWHRLLESKALARVMEIRDPSRARLLDRIREERAGHAVEFDALWASGLGGRPAAAGGDDLAARLLLVDEVFEATTRPLLFDAPPDATPEEFARLVRSLERFGASAIVATAPHAEDGALDRFCLKLCAGVEARTATDFVVVAGIEVRDPEQGLRVANAALDAGAGMLMLQVDGPDAKAPVVVCRALREAGRDVPLLVMLEDLELTEDDVVAAGANAAVYPDRVLPEAAQSVDFVARELLLGGAPGAIPPVVD